MDAVWVNELYIGTSVNNGEWTYSKLCEGIENSFPRFSLTSVHRIAIQMRLFIR